MSHRIWIYLNPVTWHPGRWAAVVSKLRAKGPTKGKALPGCAWEKKKWRGFGWFFLTTWWYSWFISGLSLAGYIP